MFEAIAARLPRVLKLEDPVFGEIAEDDNATVQAIVVTALAAVVGNLTAEGNILGNILAGLIVAPIGLFIWTGILFVVGKMFGGQGTYSQLLRPVGYAGAPFALGIVPVIGGIAGLVYSAVIQIRAVMAVNKVSQGSAIATVVIPMAVLIVGLVFLAIIASIALFAGLDALSD
jgi:hypothetical protein